MTAPVTGRVEVTLHIEQHATVVVDAPPDATEEQLTQLALAHLDGSGGAEWSTHCGWTQVRRLP